MKEMGGFDLSVFLHDLRVFFEEFFEALKKMFEK